MSDLKDKTILITGANTGIGRHTALELARRGARLLLAGRSLERTQTVIDEIGSNAEFVALDLGDLDSVVRCANDILQRNLQIDMLINNAGVAADKGVTAQGFERAFGINHLGHYLLTELLLQSMTDAAPSRIVVVASRAHVRADALDLDVLNGTTRSSTGFPEYCVSKLCNVLHAQALARRLEGTNITVCSLHPGVVASDVWRNVPWPIRPIMKRFMISEEEGSRTSVHCATHPDIVSGGYYDESKLRKPARLGRDEALADALMARSEEWTRAFR
jgi:retinol dehydrogenase 12